MSKRKPKGYWTKERCIEEALNYNTITEFKRESQYAYRLSHENKWFDEICSHLTRTIKPSGYWNLENCKIEALKYITQIDFITKSRSAYGSAYENEWLDEICSHMVSDKKQKGYWTKENCKTEALKYTTKKEFVEAESGAYDAAFDNGWMDEICSHMITIGNRFNRLIYSFEFPDNHVYIGLTYNPKNRYSNHMKYGTVFNYMNETGLTPIFKILTDYMDKEIASKMEGIKVKEYKDNGCNILNKAKTGNLGGGCKILIWTKEKCQESAKNFKSRTEFQKNEVGAYESALRNEWLDEICSHMLGYIPKWPKELCKELAIKCLTRGEFKKNYINAYQASHYYNWIDEFFPKK